MLLRPRRPLVVTVAVLLVVALVGGTVGGAVGVLRLFGDPRSVAVSENAAGFTLGDLEVAEGWWLVVGGGRTNPGEETPVYQVLADVTVTNQADDTRTGDLALVFRDETGHVVTVAYCRTGALAPGQTVTVDCEGPRQVVPTDYDRVEARLLD